MTGKKVYIIGETGIAEELDLIGVPHIGGPADKDKTIQLKPGKSSHDHAHGSGSGNSNDSSGSSSNRLISCVGVEVIAVVLATAIAEILTLFFHCCRICP